MDNHAFAVLELATSLNLLNKPRLETPLAGQLSRNFEDIAPKLLSEFIKESVALGGTVLHHFWDVLGQCDSELQKNIEELKTTPFCTPAESRDLLFRGVEQAKADFKPLMTVAAELFAHVGVAIANPGGPKPASGTPCSPSEIVEVKTTELLESLKDENPEYNRHKQVYLQVLAHRRDGNSCPVTKVAFRRPDNSIDFYPKLAHVIPPSIHNKPDTLRCIDMFAGTAMLNKVIEHLHTIDNVMNLELNAHSAYDRLLWGIEAREENGIVRYIYRTVPKHDSNVGTIRLHDDDEVKFGGGPQGNVLGHGPFLELCNLRLAVARVLQMSGATDLFGQVVEEADDSYSPFLCGLAGILRYPLSEVTPLWTSFMGYFMTVSGSPPRAILLSCLQSKPIVIPLLRMWSSPLQPSPFPSPKTDQHTTQVTVSLCQKGASCSAAADNLPGLGLERSFRGNSSIQNP